MHVTAVGLILRYGVCVALFATALGLLLFTDAMAAGILLAIGAAVSSRVLVLNAIDDETGADGHANTDIPNDRPRSG